MTVFSSATSWRNCSTSSLVAPVEADFAPSAGFFSWAWTSEPDATKNSTRRIKPLFSELMFFLSRKDLTNYERDAARLAHSANRCQDFLDSGGPGGIKMCPVGLVIGPSGNRAA